MKETLKSRLKMSVAAITLGMAAIAPATQAEELHIYNWADYIDEESIPEFAKETGMEVTYDVFDSNEVLEAKLLAGKSGYDLVVPSSHFLGRQIQAGVFQKLDKSKLPNYKYLDKDLMAVLASQDPGNAYGVPYMWGTTGIGYNVDKIKEILGDDAPVDSWDLVFKPENLEKLSKCGVNFLDSSDEIFPLAMHYVGQDPNSTDSKLYKGDSEAAKLLKELRPYVTKFASSGYIDALANGEMCVVVGWSGDVLMAQYQAEEAENGVSIEYVIPKEGTQIWFDMMAIPADAENTEGALKFINYMLDPKVIARATDYVAYANANTEAPKYQDPEVTNNPSVYPTEETKAKLYPSKIRGAKIDRILTCTWTDIKTGR
tara:strand:- start:16 stop:1134 length:1119 start_codon:yes stop_codon:yes gene_type:complete